MLDLKDRLRRDILARLAGVYPLGPEDIDFTPTPNPAMGDLALTFPFTLAKKVRQNPRAIAQEAAERLAGVEGVAKAVIAGGGYVNLYLDRGAVFAGLLGGAAVSARAPEESKVIVEHTNINPNKAAHIGHLRNAVLGDTLVRCLKFEGERVETQNYIDDTGVQVVDVVFGFLEIEKKTLPEVERIPGKFDYYCWDLYANVSRYLAEHPEAAPRKAAILKAIEHGEGEAAAMARHVSRRIVRAHLATMTRLDIGYDVLPCESSILGLHFWDRAFVLLKERGAIQMAAEGENKGCWVMRLADEEDREKVIVRSDGTVTYVGKDIAYQLWKFGLLNKDFYYEPFAEERGKTLWISTAVPNDRDVHFGGGSKVYNVIDTRQAYLQKVVVQGLRSLHYDAQADKSIHFSYEMVALSPKSLGELGYAMSEDEKDRSFLEVSGRKGLGVKADDLLDMLERKARSEVDKRNPELPEDERASIARDIARGALRYFMLKFARNSLIVFDFEEALSFEGETGPYLQYTGVRLNGIFRKLREREGTGEDEVRAEAAAAPPRLDLLAEAEGTDQWDLVFYAGQFEDEARRAVRGLEFSHLAKFAFNLCQKFNGYYHKYPVVSEEDRDVRRVRLATLLAVKDTLAAALGLMGIPLPPRM